MFNYRIIKREDCTSSKWAGGETRQIYIYPETSSYADRTFDFRISSATVDLEESDFTELEGYNRYIMTLSGSVHLKHEGHHEIKLNPFNIDYFSGTWKTKSYGKCVDFNLMLRENYKGKIEAIKNLCSFSVDFEKQVGIYSLYDDMQIIEVINGEEYLVTILSNGDMLIYEEEEKTSALLVLVNENVAQGDFIAVDVEAYKEI